MKQTVKSSAHVCNEITTNCVGTVCWAPSSETMPNSLKGTLSFPYLDPIAQVRYIKTLTWIRVFLVIFIYLVWFSLCLILFWELVDNMEWGKICNFEPKPGSHVKYVNNVRILIYRTWAVGIILGRPSTSSGVRVFMDLIGSLPLEWNICPSRPDLHVAHMGAGVPRGYPRCNKKITLRVPLSKQTSFSRKAEAWADAVHFVRSKSILPLYSLKGVSEDRSLQEIT